MGQVYLPTWTPHFYDKLVGKYTRCFATNLFSSGFPGNWSSSPDFWDIHLGGSQDLGGFPFPDAPNGTGLFTYMISVKNDDHDIKGNWRLVGKYSIIISMGAFGKKPKVLEIFMKRWDPGITKNNRKINIPNDLPLLASLVLENGFSVGTVFFRDPQN